MAQVLSGGGVGHGIGGGLVAWWGGVGGVGIARYGNRGNGGWRRGRRRARHAGARHGGPYIGCVGLRWMNARRRSEVVSRKSL